MTGTKASATLLERCLRQRMLRPLDAELGRLLMQLDPGAGPLPGLAAAVTSQAVAQGHACLPLEHLGDVLAEAAPEGAVMPELPSLTDFRDSLLHSPLCGTGDDPAQERKPLWLDADGRLYLGRHARYEAGVAQALKQLLAATSREASDADVTLLRSLLEKHFTLDAEQPDWQAMAVLTGLVSPLTVITGGPGTGKTTTVLWLLLALLERALKAGQALPHIALAAPTGKAAARLGESLHGRLAAMDIDDDIRAALPGTAATLHRLLGVRRNSSRFHHHRDHPLPADVVVVDEASMVDLPLMARLLDALHPQAQLVLLGDRDQLASVEAGHVLAAICSAAGEGGVSRSRADLVQRVLGCRIASTDNAPPCADAVVALRHSHRFGDDSGLGRLAAVIRRGDAQAVQDGLRENRFAHVDLVQPLDAAAWVVTHCVERFAALATLRNPGEALEKAAGLRVLTALREGPAGCVGINAALERELRRRAGVGAHARWYPGRLLLVTENDIDSGLFNGDIGIAWPDESGQLAAWFAMPDGMRAWPLSSLPVHVPGFAMTIHKSQGSEFDEVVIVLPHEGARVLGRELLYTAVTRARERVSLVAGARVVGRSVARSTRRFSGLPERLACASGTSGSR